MKRNLRNQAGSGDVGRESDMKWCVAHCANGASRFCGGTQWSMATDCSAICAANDPCKMHGGLPVNPTGSTYNADNIGGLSMRKATGTSFKRPRKGGTGQHVAWRNAGGTILGYTPMQVIIAVGVGVGAYFLYKKYK